LSLPAAVSIVHHARIRFDWRFSGKWSYAVYLPGRLPDVDLKYPVLYLLHGHGQSLYAWANAGHIQQTADSVDAHGDIPPAIIVMPMRARRGRGPQGEDGEPP
jgi:enterochelin esterase-like enzyme